MARLPLATRPSTGLCSWLERPWRWRPLGDALYGAAYWLVSTLLVLPLTFYQGYVREHQYGMSTQTGAAWRGEWLLSLGLSVVLGGLLVALMYAVLRRVATRWWLWTTVVLMVLAVLANVLGRCSSNPCSTLTGRWPTPRSKPRCGAWRTPTACRGTMSMCLTPRARLAASAPMSAGLAAPRPCA